MNSSSGTRKVLRFGPFEVDIHAGLLRKHGIRVRIQQQPLKVLAALLDRPGEVVTRDELRQLLWPAETYVDFEQGLNAAVTRLRQALSESADTPRFIETHARIGYRFIAPVESLFHSHSLSRSTADPLRKRTPGPVAVIFSRVPLGWMTMGLVALLSVFVGSWLVARHIDTRDISLRPVPLTTYSGLEATPSFSPDGNQVAFEWDKGDGERHIYVKLIGPGDPLQLTSGTGGEYGPAWSPDGRQIAFVRGLKTPRVSVFVVPVLGGIARQIGGEFGASYLYARPVSTRWIDWTPDGRHLIVSGADDPGVNRGLFLLSTDTGERRWLTTLQPRGEAFDRNPALSPDGRSIAFCRMSSPFVGEVYTVPLSVDLQAGDPRRLTWDGRYCASPAWSPDQSEIVFQSDRDGDTALWTISASRTSIPRRLTAAGTEVYDPAITRRGRLAYTRRFIDSNIWRQQLPSRPGEVQPAESVITSTAEDRNPQYSPVDGRIAFQSWRSGNSEIWICSNGDTHCVQLTSMNGPHTGSPRWSPDGKWIAFDSAAAGNFDIYVVDPRGGAPRRVTSDPATDAIPSWSSDGRWIFFASSRTGTSQIWKVPAEGGAAVQVTKNGGVTAFESPNGRTLYYTKENYISKLWKSDADGSAETEVLDGVLMRGFVVRDDRLYYLHLEATGEVGLRCLMLASRKDFLISLVPKPVSVGLSVSPEGTQIVYAQIDQLSSDLMLIDGFK